MVKIGSAPKKIKNAIQFIEMIDEKCKKLKFLTNVFGKLVEKIGAIYKEKCQIKLLFNWIKTHFKFKYFFVISTQALDNKFSLFEYSMKAKV